MTIKAGRTVVRKEVISHDEAKLLINEAFNAQTLRAIHDRWPAYNLSVLAEHRRQVMEYLEHAKKMAEGKELRK